MKETNAALEAKYGKSFLIYANLWEVERKVSVQDLADARAYRMAATKALYLPLTHPETLSR